ncbi:hypothetical protein KFL_000540370 [Klebsormidium nitens]|uniref:REM2- and Rab-like small GTPase 1 n=1 Tax=Klebsormidium nitens TaxID=105231 RepID=A0A0U9HIK3_KLENI|nr:hypothetical protein KFL_000540370 [Klebsormidium nitens]|eukprot:GAQ80462.1 hypothetical protein KFL_000540370 [Klebsormidium nitens]
MTVPTTGLLDGPGFEQATRSLLDDNAELHSLVKIAVVGREKAGKSALIRTLCGLEPLQNYVETAGIEVQQLLRGASREDTSAGAQSQGDEMSAPSTSFQFWEAAGRPSARFEYLLPSAASKARLALHVLSLQDRAGFDALPQQIDDVGTHVPCLVIATRHDLVYQTAIPDDELRAFCARHRLRLCLIGNPQDQTDEAQQRRTIVRKYILAEIEKLL